MNRDQARNLLAALVFDELDASTKADLLACIEADRTLQVELADLRATVDLLEQGAAREQADDEPKLSPSRMAKLHALPAPGDWHRREWGAVLWSFRTARILAAAACVVIGLVLVTMMLTPSLHRARTPANRSGGGEVALDNGWPADAEHRQEETKIELGKRDELPPSYPMSSEPPASPAPPPTEAGTGDPLARNKRLAEAKSYFGVAKDDHAAEMSGPSSRQPQPRVVSGPRPAAQPATRSINSAAGYRDGMDVGVKFRGVGGGVAGQAEAPPEPEPLPQVAMQAAAMEQLDAERVAYSDPMGYVHDARRALERGDTREARDLIEQAQSELPEASRRQAAGEELLAQAEQLKQIDRQESAGRRRWEKGQAEQLGRELARMDKRIDLYKRVVPQQEMAMAEMAEAVEAYDEPPVEQPLKPGDRLGVAVFDADQPQDEQAWMVQLGRDGRANVPLPGAEGVMDLSGLTPTEAEQRIRERIGQTEVVGGAIERAGKRDVAIVVQPDEEGEEAGAQLESPQMVDAISSGSIVRFGGESEQLPAASTFRAFPVNPWTLTERDHYSTFGIDTDDASYNLCRRYIRAGYRPPPGAVRMEEFVNAFDYNYNRQDERTFAIHAEAAPSPFASPASDTVMLKVGVKGKVLGREGRKPAHLVFVIDASGSMARDDRLGLVKHALKRLAHQLDQRDRVSIITFGAGARTHLEAASAGPDNLPNIIQTIDAIQPSGSTNMLEGLHRGYELAGRHFVSGRINRVILCSDGVANIGQTDADSILKKVAAYREQGVTLTVAGFGMGGFNDALLERLANNGDGNYLFIDTPDAAERAFVERLAATLQTIAKDAKIQVDFNPARVRRYRLIGYENRDIADEQFRDDTVDAGEVGSGQSATALYELELVGSMRVTNDMTPLGTVYVRYRDVDTDQVEEISRLIGNDVIDDRSVESNPRFYLAASAAQFAELLRNSPHARQTRFADVSRVMDRVSRALPLDRHIAELAELIRTVPDLPPAP